MGALATTYGASMKPSVYIETTIVSYLTAPSRELVIAGRQALTAEWWETRRGRFDVYVSPLVLSEAQEGDPVAAERDWLPSRAFQCSA